MKTIRVRPLPDQKQSKWQVLKSGKRISKHRLKRAAKDAARQEGQMGDELIVHDMRDKELNSVILRG